jgi:hypothetical protein
LNSLLQKELSRVVLKAMGQLKSDYRNVLALRCFDQMSYAQIAAITGGTEMQARLLFFRAKHSLKKQLAQNGLKKEHLLPALGLFGAITASSTKPASAAVVVSSSAAKVGVAAAVVGTVTSKSFIVAAAAAIIATSITVGTFKPTKNDATVNTNSNKIATVAVSTNFEQPISVIRSYDPDGSGWMGANNRMAEQSLVPVSLEKLLVGTRQTSDSNLTVIIPANHWIELGFSGEIVDGPGIDINFIGKVAGQPLRIFITDGAGQEVEITSPASYQNNRHGGPLTGLDISGLSLPFKPRALRFVGVDNQGPWGGAALWGVWARVKK